jgi:ribosomal protein S18 acetylase RimI-like enzyme
MLLKCQLRKIDLASFDPSDKIMAEERDEIKFSPLNVGHAEKVAKLHVLGISSGFISSLGVGFVSSLYEAIAESRSSFGFVAEEKDKILGFVSFATNLSQLYKSVLLRKGLMFTLCLAGKMMKLQRLKKAFETLVYPFRVKKRGLPSGELLAVVVTNESRRRNLATDLVMKGLAECARRDIQKVKVMVSTNNEPANRLYLKCGFRLVGQIVNHGILSNIYVASIGSSPLYNKDSGQDC